MLGWGWQQGTATVVARRLIKEWRDPHTETSAGGKRRRFEFILDVRPDDGSARYRATCKDSVYDPVQGDEVPVKCKPKSQKVRLDMGRRKGPSGHRKAQPRDDRWHDMLDDEPGTPPPPRRG